MMQEPRKMDWRKFLSRRWLTILICLGAGVWAHTSTEAGLTWTMLVFLLSMASIEGGTNVLDTLVYLKHSPRGRDGSNRNPDS